MGIIFGLLAGFFDALKNVSSKKGTTEHSSTAITFILVLIAGLFTLPFTLFFAPNSITPQFVTLLIVVTILDFFAFIFYTKSLSLTDLSLSLPMLAFTPIFVFIISYLFLNQTVSFIALFGICAIILGGYLLITQKNHLNISTPLSAVLKHSGVRLMLATSFIWGITNSLHKVGIQLSNPLFYTGIRYVALSLLLGIALFIKNRNELSQVLQWKKLSSLGLAGFFEAIATAFQFLSQQSLTSSVLTLALKRSSLLFSAVFGYLFFGEKINNRIVPIIIILIGILCISL
jgi:drug/metabolite transporter (DMT)-like permease